MRRPESDCSSASKGPRFLGCVEVCFAGNTTSSEKCLLTYHDVTSMQVSTGVARPLQQTLQPSRQAVEVVHAQWVG